MKKKSDLHLHTIVSDGYMTPAEILDLAKKLQLEKISITDHDAVGAYFHFGDDLFKQAKDMGITLVPGIELDSEYKGSEVHVLGYGIDIHNKELREYLEHTQSLRRQRLKEQITQANQAYGSVILNEDEIFVSHRDTLMKPHIVHCLLNREIFTEYRDGARWLSKNTKPQTEVPKPDTTEIIRLVKKAGGEAFLAHPAYYVLEKELDLDEMIKEFLPAGLDGLEAEYPYVDTSPKFPTVESEQEFIHFLKEKAREYGLKTSRGSDAHEPEKMLTFHSC
ncbi:MAG: PHP domain-containing protein [bacterium]|nr:PHP domain-containing protein [bacterium]